MKKNSITNKISPCCSLPFSVAYWWVSNLTLNSNADREFIISKISQSGTISIDAWKVLINSGTLENDSPLTKSEFLAWFDCERQPSCEQLKVLIEAFKISNYNPLDEYGVGWTEVVIYEEYSGKLIKKIENYIGGVGVLPTLLSDRIGLYYGDDILTSNQNLAVDFRGVAGADGANGTAIIEEWTAQSYVSGAMVTENYIIYKAIAPATASDVPSSSSTIWKVVGSNPSGVTIPFSKVISFDNNLAISTKTVNSPIKFTALGNYAIIGGSTLVKLTADGVNIPDFSNFKKMSGSQSYVNTAGVVNNCYFFYDGVDAWLNIWQGVGSSNIIYNDVTPPTAPTLTYSNETNTTVDLAWSGATDNVGVTSYEIYKDNVLIDTVAASPLTVTGLTAATTYAFKVKAKDASGNESAFSNTVSVTTTSQTIVNVVFDSLGGATYDVGTNTLSSSSGSTGGVRTTAVMGDFEMYTDTAISIASIVTLQSAISGGYTWVGASNVQFLIGAYVVDNKLLVNVNATAGNTGTVVADIATTDTFIKMVRAGNNCIVYSSANGTTWTARHTQSGIFTGVANLYPRVIFAVAQSNHASLKLKQ